MSPMRSFIASATPLCQLPACQMNAELAGLRLSAPWHQSSLNTPCSGNVTGYPIVFDKAMSLNVEVGRNEVLTICQIREPAPSDAAASFSAWREEASSALGIVAAMLDERVAVDERFEDAIAMKKGQRLFSLSMLEPVLRTFLPFDVTDEEREGSARVRRAANCRVDAASRGCAMVFTGGPRRTGGGRDCVFLDRHRGPYAS